MKIKIKFNIKINLEDLLAIQFSELINKIKKYK